MPEGVPGFLFVLAQAALLAVYFKRQRQAEIIRVYLETGGKPRTRWVALGLALVVAAVAFAILVGVVYLADPS